MFQTFEALGANYIDQRHWNDPESPWWDQCVTCQRTRLLHGHRSDHEFELADAVSTPVD